MKFIFCVCFYAFRARFDTVCKSMPACAIFVFIFLTLLLPDIYGGATHAVTYPHQTTIVGGAGFTDILLLWPSGASVLYTLFIAAWGAPRRNPGQEAHPWRAFLHHHFSPFSGSSTTRREEPR